MTNDYSLMIVSDIMFVETKNYFFQKTDKGVVFDDGKAFYLGELIPFNNETYEVITVPEVETVGSRNWIKVTFNVRIV